MTLATMQPQTGTDVAQSPRCHRCGCYLRSGEPGRILCDPCPSSSARTAAGQPVCSLCGCVLRRYPGRRSHVCAPCLRKRRDYNPRTDGRFSDALLALFDNAGPRIVYPRAELGISPCFRYDLQNSVRELRRRLNLRGDRLIGFTHTGGYLLVRQVDALPDR